jgi:TonB family protein
MQATAATSSLLVPAHDPIGPFLFLSAVLHIVGVGAILALSYLTLPPPIDLNQKPIRASLVRLGKPRDPELLPQKEELPPPPPKSEGSEPVPTPEKPPQPPQPAVPVPIPGVKPTNVPPAPKQNGERSEADRRKQLLGAFNRTTKGTRIRELDGQLDGDPSGDSATAEGERYWGLISSQIHRNYDVSDTIPAEDRIRLKAQVLLQIGRTGEVLRVQLLQSSGNDLFDNAVLTAARKAGPFAPPPDHLRAMLQKTGVRLEFRP